MNRCASVVVIGAGHAGIEAALASARLGVDTVLFTTSLEAIANMPCNPSIGGTAKGHLVYEIDALGGEMGRAADAVTLQSRTLNLGKGAAVHSKRVQADRKQYHIYMKSVLERTKNLRLVQSEVVAVGLDENGAVAGVTTHLGEVWSAKAVIVASGTYLDSRIFVGDVNYAGGPDGFLPAKGLSASLSAIGVRLRRFKTGTPARINRRSVDLDRLEVQEGEKDALPYSVKTPENYLDGVEQLPCHMVYTNEQTHAVIRENLTRSAMYGGHIHGTGPRYCPSIEDITILSEKSYVPIICFNKHDASSVFFGLPLKLAKKPGTDPLPLVWLVHPERIDIRAVPSVYAADKTGYDPAVLVRDLFLDGNVFVLARRECFVVLAQSAREELRIFFTAGDDLIFPDI